MRNSNTLMHKQKDIKKCIEKVTHYIIYNIINDLYNSFSVTITKYVKI